MRICERSEGIHSTGAWSHMLRKEMIIHWNNYNKNIFGRNKCFSVYHIQKEHFVMMLILIAWSNWLVRFHNKILSFLSLQLISNVWEILQDFVSIMFLFNFVSKWFINCWWFLPESTDAVRAAKWLRSNSVLLNFGNLKSNIIKFSPSLLIYSWILMFSVRI